MFANTVDHKYAKDKGISYELLDDGNSTGSGNIKPTVKVSKIKVSGISKKIAAGKKIKLTVSITPSNATNKAVTWKSGNKKIAAVNNKGVVTINKKRLGSL